MNGPGDAPSWVLDVDFSQDGTIVLEEAHDISNGMQWTQSAKADQAFAPSATMSVPHSPSSDRGFFRATFCANSNSASFDPINGYRLTVPVTTTVASVFQTLGRSLGLLPFLTDPDQMDDPVPPGDYDGKNLESLLGTLGIRIWTPPPIEDDPDYFAQRYPAHSDMRSGLTNHPDDGTTNAMDQVDWPGDTNAPLPTFSDILPEPGATGDMWRLPDRPFEQEVLPDNDTPQPDEVFDLSGTHLRLGFSAELNVARLDTAMELAGRYAIEEPPSKPDLDAFVWVARSRDIGDDIYFLRTRENPWEAESFDESGGLPNEYCSQGTAELRVPVPIPDGVDISDLTIEAYRYVRPFEMDALTIENFLANLGSFELLLRVEGGALTEIQSDTRRMISSERKKASEPAPLVTMLHRSGATNSKKTIAVIGDGFANTDVDQGAFTGYVHRVIMKDLFSQDINAEILNALNIVMIQTYSASSGITRIDATNHITSYQDTALDWWYSGLHPKCWMQYGSNTKARTDAIINTLCPEAEYVITVLNINAFGGCARGASFAGTRQSGWSTMAHEFGHMFGKLGDEYRCASEGDLCCAYTGSEPGYANLTTNTVRACVKWREWIPPYRPVPTAGTNVADSFQDVGLFEAATTGTKKHWRGIFRPTKESRMSNNSPPFNPVGYSQVREIARTCQTPNFHRNAFGDFNGDGMEDVVLRDGRQIQLYCAGPRLLGSKDPITQTNLRSAGFVLNPTWFFTGELSGTNPTSCWSFSHSDYLRVADFDGDGKDDLFVIDPTGGWLSTRYFGMLRSTGSSFVPVNRYKEKLPGWMMKDHDQYFVIDFDSDGKDDLVVYNGQDWSVPYLCMFRSTGTNLVYTKIYSKFLPGSDSNFEMGKNERIKVGHFQGEGTQGLIFHNRDDFAHGRILVYSYSPVNEGLNLLDHHYGPISLTGQVVWNLGSKDVLFNLDYNGDGSDDLMLFNGVAWDRAYLLCMNNSDGYFFPERNYASGGSDLDVAGWWLARRDRFSPADVDGDGRMDLVAYNAENWDTEYLGVIRYLDQQQARTKLQGTYQSGDWVGAWNLGPNDNFRPAEFGGSNNWSDLYIYNTNWFGMLRGGGSGTFVLETIYPKWIHNHRYHSVGWW